MKHLTWVLMVLGLSHPAFAQVKLNSNEFILNGHIIGQDSGYVHLRYMNLYGQYQHDSCFLNNGKFQLRGKLKEPGNASFYGNRKSRSIDDPNFTEIFLEPGIMQASFKVHNFKQGRITGSKSQNEFSIYNRQYDSLRYKWKSTWDNLKLAKEQNDIHKIETINSNEIAMFDRESNDLCYSFIKKFSQSYVSVYLLDFQTQKLSLDSLKILFTSLAPSIQRSRHGNTIATFIRNAENLVIGAELPNFTKADINGKKVSLRDFRGKYTLVDFWASWCVPCREEHPYLKSAYAKYRDRGFTIISFSLDDEKTKDAWEAAIKKDSLPWTHLCDFKSWGSEVVQQYNLMGKGIPANFLIDPRGRILAKDLRGEELEKKLGQVISNGVGK